MLFICIAVVLDTVRAQWPGTTYVAYNKMAALLSVVYPSKVVQPVCNMIVANLKVHLSRARSHSSAYVVVLATISAVTQRCAA